MKNLNRTVNKIFRIKEELHDVEEHLRENEFDAEADDIHWAALVCFSAGVSLHKQSKSKRKGDK